MKEKIEEKREYAKYIYIYIESNNYLYHSSSLILLFLKLTSNIILITLHFNKHFLIFKFLQYIQCLNNTHHSNFNKERQRLLKNLRLKE